jgi:hypothetical protein
MQDATHKQIRTTSVVPSPGRYGLAHVRLLGAFLITLFFGVMSIFLGPANAARGGAAFEADQVVAALESPSSFADAAGPSGDDAPPDTRSTGDASGSDMSGSDMSGELEDPDGEPDEVLGVPEVEAPLHRGFFDASERGAEQRLHATCWPVGLERPPRV